MRLFLYNRTCRNYLYLTVLLFVIFLPGLVMAEHNTDNSKAALVRAIALMQEGRHSEAIAPLESASKGLPLIEDHILTLLAEAYASTGDHIKASSTAASVVKKYPNSPAARKAHKIRAISDSITHPERGVTVFKAFLRKYKNDDEIRMELAKAYIMEGKNSRADKILAEIFAEAGPQATEAYQMIYEPEKLSRRIWLKRARSLMDELDFEGAEAILRGQLSPEGWNRAIKKNLARTLFRQRKYKEAAPVYLMLGDMYMAARSHLRAGYEKEFYELVEDMYDKHDRLLPKLIIAHAADMRREGNNDLAEKMLERLHDAYPEASEKITWALGWHYYQRGLSHTAHKYFERLALKHPDEHKYIYWMARTGEKIGIEVTELYESITGEGYYPLLARTRLGLEDKSIDHSQPELKCSLDTRRADLLIEVGMNKEAAAELQALANRRRIKNDDLLSVAYRMQSVGLYRQAMLLTLRVPEAKQPIDLLYPQAYWETVMDVSTKYTMDPLLVLSLIREESHYDREARSKVGAIGLMQLMPETAMRTARKAQVAIQDTDDVFDVGNNITIGSYYLNSLLMEFKNVPASLAAYNAGENRVRKWLSQGAYEGHDEFIEDIPFTETRNYVKRILSSHSKYNSYLSRPQVRASL